MVRVLVFIGFAPPSRQSDLRLFVQALGDTAWPVLDLDNDSGGLSFYDLTCLLAGGARHLDTW